MFVTVVPTTLLWLYIISRVLIQGIVGFREEPKVVFFFTYWFVMLGVALFLQTYILESWYGLLCLRAPHYSIWHGAGRATLRVPLDVLCRSPCVRRSHKLSARAPSSFHHSCDCTLACLAALQIRARWGKTRGNLHRIRSLTIEHPSIRPFPSHLKVAPKVKALNRVAAARAHRSMMQCSAYKRSRGGATSTHSPLPAHSQTLPFPPPQHRRVLL